MSEFYNNSIFWVEVDRISPNPYQPRKEFNDDKIAELADSIRQYGVLQPLVVTRQETERPDGGITVEYELIAGERRLRASKLAGVPQVPVIIRAQEETSKMKLELAIIENLQREDLNAMDRARAFKQLVDEFNLKHIEIAKKVGKSREYVSNTLRLLGLPEYIQNALVAREISEGHARPLLMLAEREAERDTLFKEITTKRLTVRESERIARRIATDKARKQDLSPELISIEKDLTETLGTRVQIEKRSDKGGKVHIDYFSEEDLRRLLDMLAKDEHIYNSNTEDVQMVEPKSVEQAIDEMVPATAVVNTANEALQKFNDTFTSPTRHSVELEVEQEQVKQSIEATEPVEAKAPINPFAIPAPDIESASTSITSIQPSEQSSNPEPVNPFTNTTVEAVDPDVDKMITEMEEILKFKDVSSQAPISQAQTQTQNLPNQPEAIDQQQIAPTQNQSNQNTNPDNEDDLYSLKNFSI